MPASNELRVFVSSTFRDLQEEREHLVRKIFPEIRALCRERGVTFTEVDLRWGLTDEDVVLGQVIRTCLEEIDRCRPYFIGITGERYGYIPDLVDIYKDSELLAKYPWIEDATMEGASIIDLEFRHGALNDAATSHASSRFFFRRTRRGSASSVDGDEGRALESLKQRVRDGGYDVEEFRDPEHLGEAIFDALVEIIERDFDPAPPGEIERERASHEAFAASRRHAYIPNPDYLSALNAWHADAEAPPLIIYAESGSGKSSLVSFWCQQRRRRDPEAFIVEHYVGIGAGAADHYAIMRHVMSEIRERFSRTEEIPSKPEELEAQFGNWLGFTVGAPMLLVIDGVNQLTGRALELHWLPPVMPPGVKLIITSTVEQTLVDLRRRGWRELAMQPLKEREREGVIVRYLSEYHKALAKDQVTLLAEDIKCAHPLFLRTLLEELRIDSSHEKLYERIALYLGTSGTEDLFQKVLERMENDFGTRVVREVMSLVWCSRFGLEEEDLQAVTGISRLKLSTMLGGLDYHLVRKDGVLTFFHDYLRRAVEKRYLAEERVRLDVWRRLVEHFAAAPVTIRATKELVWSLGKQGERERLLETIADVERFDLLFQGESQYEVLAHWSGVEAGTTARIVLTSLREWRVRAGGERVLQVLGRVSTLLASLGCMAEALGIDEERHALAVELGDRPEQGRAHASMCWRLRVLGDTVAAEEHGRRAEAIAREIEDWQSVASTVGNRGLMHLSRGEYEQALACYAESEAMARMMGDRKRVASAVGNRGNVHVNRGEYERALACYVEQEAIAREIGDRQSLARVVGCRGSVHLKRGEYELALACSAESEAIGRSIGDRQTVSLVVGNRGVAHLDRGEYALALACFAEKEAIAREIGDRQCVAFAVGNRGIVHMSRGEHELALACYAEQEAIARAIGDRQCVAFAVGNRGNLHVIGGAFAMALEPLVAAIDLFRDIGDQPPLCALLVDSSRALLECSYLDELRPQIMPYITGDGPWRTRCVEIARQHAEEALAIAQELGARDTVGQAEVVLGRIDAVNGHDTAARGRLLRMLAAATELPLRAETCYWLWKLGLDPAPDHRADAERIYAELYARIPMHDYKVRLDELRAAVASS
jgi:tetratricopeptide (TPR) repeat protein